MNGFDDLWSARYPMKSCNLLIELRRHVNAAVSFFDGLGLVIGASLFLKVVLEGA